MITFANKYLLLFFSLKYIKMKTLKPILCALITLTTLFTNCKKEEILPHDLSGTYIGYTLTNSQFFSNYFTNEEKVVIESVNEETIKLTLYSTNWGTTTVTNMKINSSGKTCSFSGNGSIVINGMQGGSQTYDCTLIGTVDENKHARVTVNVPAVMGGTSIVFTSGTAPTDYYVADTYEGNIEMSIMNEPQGEPTLANITLEPTGNNAVNIILPSIGEGNMSIPSLIIPNIPIATSDHQTFTIVETSFEQTVDNRNYTGTITGAVSDSKLTLNYSIKPGAMPVNIICVFTTNDNNGKLLPTVNL